MLIDRRNICGSYKQVLLIKMNEKSLTVTWTDVESITELYYSHFHVLQLSSCDDLQQTLDRVSATQKTKQHVLRLMMVTRIVKTFKIVIKPTKILSKAAFSHMHVK